MCLLGQFISKRSHRRVFSWPWVWQRFLKHDTKSHIHKSKCDKLNFRASIYQVTVSQSRPTLCDGMDYTGHGLLQAGTLEWAAFPFSMGSSQPRDQTQVSHIASGFFTSWATREAFSNYQKILFRMWRGKPQDRSYLQKQTCIWRKTHLLYIKNSYKSIRSDNKKCVKDF